MCDLDYHTDGSCLFRLGVCLNYPGEDKCDDELVYADVVQAKGSVNVGPYPDMASQLAGLRETIASQLATLAPLGSTSMPMRCAIGLRGKECHVDSDCNTSFGKRNGVCGRPTGVRFVGGSGFRRGAVW